MDSNNNAPPEALEALSSDFDDEKAPRQPPNALGPVKRTREWFTFENRCMVCGEKFPGRVTAAGSVHHLEVHCEEGILKKWGKFYEQVKAHPVGFPGILLPVEMQWTK